jgi:hypothetical protein
MRALIRKVRLRRAELRMARAEDHLYRLQGR